MLHSNPFFSFNGKIVGLYVKKVKKHAQADKPEKFKTD
jgi:hypothetical protein